MLLRPLGHVVYFMPPYVVDEDDIALMTRTAVEVPLGPERETWQLRLLDILEKLARAVEMAAEATGR